MRLFVFGPCFGLVLSWAKKFGLKMCFREVSLVVRMVIGRMTVGPVTRRAGRSIFGDSSLDLND